MTGNSWMRVAEDLLDSGAIYLMIKLDGLMVSLTYVFWECQEFSCPLVSEPKLVEQNV